MSKGEKNNNKMMLNIIEHPGQNKV